MVCKSKTCIQKSLNKYIGEPISKGNHETGKLDAFSSGYIECIGLKGLICVSKWMKWV